MNPYIAVLLVMIVALGISCAMLVLSRLLGPRKPSAVKLQPYECGMTPIGGARVRFSVKFYLTAILFIVFDVEVVFLYPWAVTFRPLGMFGFVEMAIFVLVLALGFVYVWRKGALEWS